MRLNKLRRAGFVKLSVQKCHILPAAPLSDGITLLPGDCSLLWLSNGGVDLVSCGTPVWGFRLVRERSYLSWGFQTTLYWLLPCPIWWIPIPSLLFTPFWFFVFSHFCLFLLWSFFWQEWLIDRHLFIQDSAGICQYWLDPVGLVKIKNITITLYLVFVWGRVSQGQTSFSVYLAGFHLGFEDHVCFELQLTIL